MSITQLAPLNAEMPCLVKLITGDELVAVLYHQIGKATEFGDAPVLFHRPLRVVNDEHGVFMRFDRWISLQADSTIGISMNDVLCITNISIEHTALYNHLCKTTFYPTKPAPGTLNTSDETEFVVKDDLNMQPLTAQQEHTFRCVLDAYEPTTIH